MNKLDSYFEINKENILSKDKSTYSKDYFYHQDGRLPLQDITFMYTSSEKSSALEEKV